LHLLCKVRAVWGDAIPLKQPPPLFCDDRECVMVRRFRAKPRKEIVDVQAARPSSWKTPCMATFIVW
jgi:hypothetical protein